MPISLSSILFENDPVANAQNNNQSTTGQAGMPSREDIRALANKRYYEGTSINPEPLTPSDIGRNVDTIIAVATGEEYSDDPEDLEFDRQSGNAVTTKQQSPELPDLSSLLDTETEVESLNENEGEETIDDEVEQLLKRYEDKNIQQNLFKEIFGGADPVFEHMSQKGIFFRVKVIKDPTKDLSDAHEVDALAAKVKNEQQRIQSKYDVYIIKKKQPGSGSGTFDTWSIFDNKTDRHISVVFANGGNKGHEFEGKVGAEFDKKLGPAWEALRNYLLIPSNDPDGVGVDLLTNLESFDLTNQSSVEPRPFTGKISDVGEVISDLTLNVRRKKNLITKIYISLKGEKGKTISNNGYPGFTVDKYTGEVNAPSLDNMTGVDSDLLEFAKAVGLDNSLIAKGLTRWINAGEIEGEDPKTPQVTVQITPAQGTEALKYVTAQIGYGYIYFREKSGGRGFTIMTLKDAGDIGKLVGNFTGGEIRYPYYVQNNPGHPREGDPSTRQCTIRLNTDKANYNVEIRKAASVSARRTDAATGLQCNMQITKIHDIPKAAVVVETRTKINGTTSQKAPVLLSSLLWPQRLHQ